MSFGKNTYDQHRTSRILAGLLIGICSVLIVLLAATRLRSHAKSKIQEVLTKWENHEDYPVVVNSWKLGLTTVTFSNIVIGKNSEVAVSEIVADVHLLPFSSSFGTLKALQIDRVKIKTEANDFYEIISKLKNRLQANQSNSNTPTQPAKRLFAKLPFSEKLHIRSGGLRITDSFGRHIYEGTGISLLIDRAEEKVVFHLARLRTADGKEEQNIEGRFSHQKKKYGFWIGKQMRKSRSWYLKGQLNADFDQAQFSVDTRTMPNFLVPFVRPYIFQPEGMQSSTKFQVKKENDATWKFSTNSRITGIRLAHRLISPEVIGPFAVSFGTKGTWLPGEDLVNFEKGQVTLLPKRGSRYRPVKVLFSGGSRVSRQDETRELFGVLNLPPTPCQSLVDSPPRNFAPRLESFKIGGLASATIEFNLPISRPEDFFYNFVDKQFDCVVNDTPFIFSKDHLQGPFSVTRNHNGDEIRVPINPQSDAYSPLAAISPHITKAFVISEDASFWKHDGIDGHALEAAFRTNLNESKVVIGGSTITMQTVKNLFLSNRRTFSRKYQEMILAWYLDDALGKERIFEIYLNLVEFGPGIYGITKATEHYFGKHPFDVNLKEAIFLANLLPSPVKRHRHFCNGEVSAEYKEMMDGLLRRMLNLHRIGYGSYANSLRAPLIFNDDIRMTSPLCPHAPLSSETGAG